jgi:hypothetical protein
MALQPSTAAAAGLLTGAATLAWQRFRPESDREPIVRGTGCAEATESDIAAKMLGGIIRHTHYGEAVYVGRGHHILG